MSLLEKNPTVATAYPQLLVFKGNLSNEPMIKQLRGSHFQKSNLCSEETPPNK